MAFEKIVFYLLAAILVVELLAESKFLSLTAAGIATTLNSSRSRWQRLDALITIPRKESPACS